MTFELLSVSVEELRRNLSARERGLRLLKRACDRGMSMPFFLVSESYYGGAFLDAIGVRFDDLDHWDVPDMRAVLPEAFELVAQELMSSADFRDFACDNVLRLHAGMNPEFFTGTGVEAYAKDFLGSLRDASSTRGRSCPEATRADT